MIESIHKYSYYLNATAAKKSGMFEMIYGESELQLSLFLEPFYRRIASSKSVTSYV